MASKSVDHHPPEEAEEMIDVAEFEYSPSPPSLTIDPLSNEDGETFENEDSDEEDSEDGGDIIFSRSRRRYPRVRVISKCMICERRTVKERLVIPNSPYKLTNKKWMTLRVGISDLPSWRDQDRAIFISICKRHNCFPFSIDTEFNPQYIRPFFSPVYDFINFDGKKDVMLDMSRVFDLEIVQSLIRPMVNIDHLLNNSPNNRLPFVLHPSARRVANTLLYNIDTPEDITFIDLSNTRWYHCFSSIDEDKKRDFKTNSSRLLWEIVRKFPNLRVIDMTRCIFDETFNTCIKYLLRFVPLEWLLLAYSLLASTEGLDFYINDLRKEDFERMIWIPENWVKGGMWKVMLMNSGHSELVDDTAKLDRLTADIERLHLSYYEMRRVSAISGSSPHTAGTAELDHPPSGGSSPDTAGTAELDRLMAGITSHLDDIQVPES